MKRKKLTEADVTAESVFMLKRRQMLKMLGISATALSLPAAARMTCWTGLKATTAHQRQRARPSSLLNLPSGRLI